MHGENLDRKPQNPEKKPTNFYELYGRTPKVPETPEDHNKRIIKEAMEVLDAHNEYFKELLEHYSTGEGDKDKKNLSGRPKYWLDPENIRNVLEHTERARGDLLDGKTDSNAVKGVLEQVFVMTRKEEKDKNLMKWKEKDVLALREKLITDLSGIKMEGSKIKEILGIKDTKEKTEK